MAYFDIYGSATPATINGNYGGSVVLGLQFQSVVACNVQGVKFYKGTSDTGTHVGTLWTDAGVSLASANFTGETTSGWQTLTFGSPVAIAAATNYRVSYLCPTGFGDNTTGYFTSAQPSSLANPLSVATIGGCYKYSAGNTFPNTSFLATGYFVQPFVDASWGPFSMIRDVTGEQCVVGALQGIAMGGPTSINGDGTFGRHMQTGVVENFVDGNPTAPCLQLTYPGFWRFRASYKVGVHSAYISVKQPHFLPVSYGSPVSVFYPPSMIIKANPAIGLNSDIIGTAPVSQEWVQIVTEPFLATAAGAVWIELWNNNTAEYNTPALFDHIIFI